MLEKYLRHLTIERGLSKNTLAAYQRDLISLSQYLDSFGFSLESATEAQLRSFVEKLLSEGFARSSTARSIASIRGFYKFLVEEGALSIDPAARMDAPKLPLRLPKALNHEQVLSLLEAAGPEPASEFFDSIGLRNRAILELMYSTGARVSEISNLDLDEIHNEGFVRVKGKGSKERVVPIGSYAQASLDAYLIRGRPDLVKKSTPALWLNKFGGRLSRQSIWEVVQIAGKKCGVEVSPHTLRHCFATHLIEGGADVRVVQELLGHASVTTTQIYTKVTLDSLREVYQLSHPRARR